MTNSLSQLLSQVGLNASTPPSINGSDPVLPSRFRIGEAAATALAGCGAAANELWKLNGNSNQHIIVDVQGAAVSLISFLCQRLDDNSQPERDPNRALVALYKTKDDRWIHLHGAFPTLAEGTMAILNCQNTADSVSAAVAKWDAETLESSLAEAGLCGAMVRTRDEWLRHPQGIALSAQSPVVIRKIADSEPKPIPVSARPLGGIQVLDLTRVLAGPTCARTLASHGARVLKINSPNLPSVPPFVMDTGHGKRSAFLDLNDALQATQLKNLAQSADVFSQGYRKGALDNKGFGPDALAEINPGIVYVSINAYGHVGPWANRPGWEQLAQSASGVAADEGTESQPKLIGAAATDYTTGYLAALGTMAALYKRATEGGSYHVEVSLAQTANWLYEFGLFERDRTQPSPNADLAAPYMTQSNTGFGLLHHLGPIIQMSETPPRWDQPTGPLGSHEASWW